jgi:hypothetical protein
MTSDESRLIRHQRRWAFAEHIAGIFSSRPGAVQIDRPELTKLLRRRIIEGSETQLVRKSSSVN